MTARTVGGLLLAALVSGAATAYGQDRREWSFSEIERIELEGLSGDVLVRASASTELRVLIDSDVQPPGAFRSSVSGRGSVLRLRERWGPGPSRGNVGWVLEVPASKEPRIEIRSTSGGLELVGVKARIDFSSSSGDVRAQDAEILSGSRFDTSSGDLALTRTEVHDHVALNTSSGDIDLVGVTAGRDFRFSTSSGHILIEDSEGVVHARSSSGDVRVRDSRIEGPSRFSSSSGDILVRLSRLPGYDLEVSSSSGDVRLEVAQFPDHFTLELTKRRDRGRIDVPFEYSSERSFLRGLRLYEQKTVTRGVGSPLVRLSTASGSITVRTRGRD